MIIAQICGGLGNQMFQYALGRRLAHDRGVALKLDLTPLATDPLRDYACDQFAVTATVADAEELARSGVEPPPRGFFARLLRGAPPPVMRVVREAAFTFDPDVLAAPADAHLIGYWQSERYFVDAADLIREEFRLARPMHPARAAVHAEIAAAAAPISVHVRRGDYVSNPTAAAYHGTCSPDWYAAAMTRVAEGVDDPTFFVFSDDPAWARDNLPSDRRRVFVAPLDDGRDGEDMHLMAACRRHVIANSSFSWWGAWLDPSPDKRVVAPARWFASAPHDTRDLLPSSWERL